jgi:hypothetical protein
MKYFKRPKVKNDYSFLKNNHSFLYSGSSISFLKNRKTKKFKKMHRKWISPCTKNEPRGFSFFLFFFLSLIACYIAYYITYYITGDKLYIYMTQLKLRHIYIKFHFVIFYIIHLFILSALYKLIYLDICSMLYVNYDLNLI